MQATTRGIERTEKSRAKKLLLDIVIVSRVSISSVFSILGLLVSVEKIFWSVNSMFARDVVLALLLQNENLSETDVVFVLLFRFVSVSVVA